MVTEFDRFLCAYPSLVFQRDQMILMKDEVPRGTYIIESGIVKTYNITMDGEERIVSIDTAGEDIPIGYTFGLIDKCNYFYEAYTKCRIRIVPREDYVEYLAADRERFYRRHLRVVKILLKNLERIEALEQSKASRKVAQTLLYFAETLGSAFPSKTTRCLSVTQQEIANALGMTRETISIAFKKLELRKLLAHSRNTQTIYLDRIKKYLAEET